MKIKVTVLVQELKTIVPVYLVLSLKKKKRNSFCSRNACALVLLITKCYAQYRMRGAILNSHLNVGCLHQFFYFLFRR